MAYCYYSDEEARLQRKLIPLNIVVCVLCIVAMVSLLFAPLFKFDAKKLGQELKTILYAEGSDSSNDSAFASVELLNNLEGELSFNAVDLGKASFVKNITLEDIIDSLLVKPGLIDKGVIYVANVVAIEKLTDITGISNADLSSIENAFKSFGDVNTPDEMRKMAGEWVDAVNAKFPDSINEIDKLAFEDEFVKQYENTVEATGGPFDLEKFVCVLGSDYLDLGQTYTSYSAFLADMLDKDGVITQKLADMGEIAKLIPKSLFSFVMSCVFAWFLLFLFAFFHTFAKNKRFMMWYVKLGGFYPCLFFGVIPLVGGILFKSAGGLLATLGALFGAMSSLVWISGGCYMLLWIVSIFWAFPIKHRIRKERKS